MENEDNSWDAGNQYNNNRGNRGGRKNRNGKFWQKNNPNKGKFGVNKRNQNNRNKSRGAKNKNNYTRNNNRGNKIQGGSKYYSKRSINGTKIGGNHNKNDHFRNKNLEELNRHLEAENEMLKMENEKLKQKLESKDRIIKELQSMVENKDLDYKGGTFKSNGSRILDSKPKIPKSRKRKRFKKANTFAPTESLLIAQSEKMARELQMEEYAYQMQIDQIMKLEQMQHAESEQEMLQRAIEESKKANPDIVNPDAMTYEELCDLGDKIGTVNIGLSPSVISKIERILYSTRNHDEEECIVCASEYSIGQELLKLPCNHVFDDCILKWFKENRTCPICKEEVTEQNIRKKKKKSNLVYANPFEDDGIDF